MSERNSFRVFAVLLMGTLCLGMATVSRAASTEELLKTLKNVGREGQGNVAAAKALQELTQKDADVLPEILKAFEGAGPLAINWLRGGFETIADKSIKQKEPLPTKELKSFIENTKQDRNARRLAFEWLRKVEPQTAEQMVPSFLNDPSAELRREAVAKLLKEAKAIEEKESPRLAVAVYKKALSGAVDEDQVKEIVAPLKKLGEKVDLPKHFGFLTDWQIIGPFENRGGVGFAAVYPPEKGVDLSETYETKFDDGFEGGKVGWNAFQTGDEYGVVNIRTDIKNYKGSCMYATTTFESDKDQTVQLRLGTPNAWKLWVNGKEVFAREEYHRGTKMDQYRVSADLKKGENEILVKVCQNEQTQDWAQRYQFQLRVCDPAGSAILPANAK
ncbi:MAG: hypothetical protein KDA84_21940 [Planctomycetaceae bacterium]|nr:hypothetical protein [Planctomycetaceae bacterium]